MALGPLGLALFVGFTLFACVLIFTELTSVAAKLVWIALLAGGIYLAPTGTQTLAPVATILIIGGKAGLERAKGSAV